MTLSLPGLSMIAPYFQTAQLCVLGIHHEGQRVCSPSSSSSCPICCLGTSRAYTVGLAFHRLHAQAQAPLNSPPAAYFPLHLKIKSIKK